MPLDKIGVSISDLASSTPPRKPKEKRKSKKSSVSDNSIQEKIRGYQRISKLIEYDDFSSFAISVKNVIETKQENEINSLLDWYITTSEEEILEVCKQNYETFLRFAEELKYLNRSTVSMKSTIESLTKNLSSSTSSFYESMTKLNQHIAVKNKTEKVIMEIEGIIHILNTIEKVNMYIEERKIHQALKLLNKLETIYLKDIYGYSIVQKINMYLIDLKISLNKEERSGF